MQDDSPARALELLQSVEDPEIPGLSIVDLGIVRAVRGGREHLSVDITPTYSGCPALDVIRKDIEATLSNGGWSRVEVNVLLSPPWTTDWITERGRRVLRDSAIAPPEGKELVEIGGRAPRITCPRCSGVNTELRSEFGATACKAFFYCQDCQEPFEYFKQF